MQAGWGSDMLTVGVKREYLLDGFPCFEINDWRAVLFNGQISKFQNTDVEFVLEEGAI